MQGLMHVEKALKNGKITSKNVYIDIFNEEYESRQYVAYNRHFNGNDERFLELLIQEYMNKLRAADEILDEQLDDQASRTDCRNQDQYVAVANLEAELEKVLSHEFLAECSPQDALLRIAQTDALGLKQVEKSARGIPSLQTPQARQAI